MNKEERKQYAQLDKQIQVLLNKMDVIEAKHKKAIWTDHTYDKDRKDILRKAELTLRLAEDTLYQPLQEQLWELEAQRSELGNMFEL